MNVRLGKSYTYMSSNNGTGNLVSSYGTSYLVQNQQTSLLFYYTYDGNGNITSVTQTEQSGPAYTIVEPDPDYDVSVMSLDGGENTTSATYRTYYSYDEAGQLVEAIDGVTGITYRYSYDSSGNIKSMNAYEYDDSGNEVLIASKTFTYTNGILSGYTDGSTSVICNSDIAGNLTSTYGGTHTKVLTWGEGRNLMGVRKNTTNYTEYAYNVDGLRTQKTVVENGVSTTTQYIWGNNGLAAIITGDTTVVPIYDNDGEAVGFFVEETEEYTPAIPNVVTQKVYTYVKNLQGDVIRILDENGNTVVSYTYDPWGVPTVTGDADLAALNPCSYRGYDYDEETGYYYLKSRYYDPEISKFINPDVMIDTGFILGFNLFSYCGNCPVLYTDPSGYGRIYVIYYNFPGKDFYSQAMNSPYYNIRNNNVYLISVVSVRDFIAAWNSMTGSIDYVYLYLHGGTGKLYFNEEELGFGTSPSFSSLSAKNVKRGVYLFSCYGGSGKEGNNVAWMFAKLTGSNVYACTGSVSYSRIFGKYYARKAFDWGIIKTFYYQKRYIFWGPMVARSAPGQW